ncbi:DUF3152 domain-containing protein [Streptomyces sp. NPDC058758]|uniref:DUF3152 domain-containing protein n=1 Tax=Streptomyces sp. NPDC058758 TaxID=3346627 RepID=UPI0036CB1E09
MGRHSRKGPAPSAGDTGRTPVADTGRTPVVEGGAGTGRRRRSDDGGPEERGAAARGTTRGHGAFHGYPPPAQGAPAHGAPAQGTPPRGTAAPAAPPYGTPAHGTPRYGTPPYGGTPAHGTPAHGGGPGTPAHGTPAYTGGGRGAPAHTAPHTPAHGTPVRGGHPAHEEALRPGPERYGPATGAPPLIPGPRRAAAAPPAGPAPSPAPEGDTDGAGGRGGLGKALTGIAAAAVTTCLAIVVAGQVADREDGTPAARAAQEPADRASGDTSASRSDERPTPPDPAPATRQPAPTYEQLMTRQFPIDPKLTGSGEFEAVPGLDKAPGSGQKYRYRVDVEKGLGLDAKLFARAIQQTLNDKRSWAGQGAMTFERISSGDPDFVITLASPGTTGAWCAKSGLDTTIDNVSCDSASTERVMINAFRWAQGAETFGPKAMHAYRQMLINHEVGHRLGHNHVSCRTPGALAPVMQQQTKSLEIDGIVCRPNPWVYPGS